MNDNQKFLMGINYWPAHKAMYWWRDFEVREVDEDFKKLAENNFQLVRIFLTWEDFQPSPDMISAPSIDNLKRTADIASAHGLRLMPTFFCGHMSGINWMPAWMLAPGEGKGRFPVFSNNQANWSRIRNCYTDQKVIDAQCIQIQAIVSGLKDHEAIFGYDLGNETSNWVIPPDRSAARKWLETMTSEIKRWGGGALVTLGMHAEDLEDDRQLWPQDAASYCDFLCMHGYPYYLTWVDDPIDPDLVPFLGIITAWLGQKPVLFQEFGVPTHSVLLPTLPAEYESMCQCPLWTEEESAVYYNKVLQGLIEAGMMGGIAWCYTDYAPVLWDKQPLHDIFHERHFGLFRHDGTAKPAVEIFGQYQKSLNHKVEIQARYPWLNEKDRDKFYLHPRNNLSRLYQRYKEWLKGR